MTDSSTDYRGYPDTSGITINYDSNGNMKNHVDKGIENLDYNYLNLPNYILFNFGLPTRGGIIRNNLSYLYRADGVKLKKIYNYAPANPDGTVMELSTEVIDYIDGFQYKGNGKTGKGGFTSLLFYPTTQGYYDFVKNKYIYNYADHLGNTRLSYFHNGSSVEVLEESNYYPFGLKHEGYNPTAGNPNYQYKYNGKELQETGMYDYGARMYMPDIGRWGVVDPLAEKDRRWTPYRYAYNNPLRFIDPDGRNEELVITGQDADIAVKELNDDSALKLSRNNQTGKVSIDNKSKINYKNLSAVDKKLFDVIESTDKTINLSTTRDLIKTTPQGGQEAFVIGKFHGQTSANANPEVNVIQSQGLENSGGQTSGTSIRHEIFESFIAVELAQSFDLLRNFGVIGPNSSSINFYQPAHDAAKSLDPSFNFTPQGNQLYLQKSSSGQPSALWYNSNKNANINSTGWIKLQ
ncbi:RHS repeat domain-containing protein [Chryseobacterium luquanense]|uniref:RHS repeat-associated core domain-containing protein n=1 Tax=Chryseobacterium luquanense TaxID=2983766 RepID=A0ABT3Y1X6_9FLAO|nr:RHS repeat-associated core domain-containing protein [Chryseobacterium luquanense]MCX8532081.1 RHS repeat-associated core domain-containing protein [Chryseobacterium luquanense]